MNHLDLLAFAELFRKACLKCFGSPLKDPLTETESKLLYNQIFDQTGLTIGWKSLKNYSFFVLADHQVRQENPSVATLDTLARYVLQAPYTTEPERKKKENHYPYWFRFREQFFRSREGLAASEEMSPTWHSLGNSAEVLPRKKTFPFLLTGIVAAVVMMLLIFFYWRRSRLPESFTEPFHSLNEDSLSARGWFVQAKDSVYWGQRGEQPGSLNLFTLQGDNWPDTEHPPGIRNLVLRKIPCSCFGVEARLKNFLPHQNWQQAGILLLEDTGFVGKSIRVSIAYNDYMGTGNPKKGAIILQVITSSGNRSPKPEEFANIPLLVMDSLKANSALSGNLENAALRIEKQGHRFRFLYANGSMENSSFKEAGSHEFSMTPRYAGLFALKGFVDTSASIPARFNFFRLDCDPCSP